MFDLAIIGFGTTGVSLLKQLQEEVACRGIKRLRIAVIAPDEKFAKGRDFGCCESFLHVNSEASLMGISTSDPLGFVIWLRNRGISSPYPARSDFAEYLRDTFGQILSLGTLFIEEIHECAQTATLKSGHLQITTRNRKLAAKEVVLCIGRACSSLFPEVGGALRDLGHNFGVVARQPLRDRILVAGSGLTAIDAFRSISRHYPDSEIHMFSRHGMPPTCATRALRYQPRLMTWPNLLSTIGRKNALNSVVCMFKRERELLPDGGEPSEAMDLLRQKGLSPYFLYLMGRAKQSNLPIQDVLISMRLTAHRIWVSLPKDQKLQFDRHLRSRWMTWRHPAPYFVVEEMQVAAAEGRLHIHQSRRPPGRESGRLVLDTEDGNAVHAACLVDGTGGTNDLNRTKDPFIRCLRHRRMIEADPRGGIRINPFTYQCCVGDQPVPGLYSLGAITQGSLFSTNSVWFNVHCAAEWARNWMARYPVGLA